MKRRHEHEAKAMQERVTQTAKEVHDESLENLGKGPQYIYICTTIATTAPTIAITIATTTTIKKADIAVSEGEFDRKRQ